MSAMATAGAQLQLVRCPKCLNVLPEPPGGVLMYMCGGCDAVLRVRGNYSYENAAKNPQVAHAGSQNSSSAVVPEENEKRISLLNDHDNNPFQVSYNKEMKRVENPSPPAEPVIPSTRGHGSTSPRKSEDARVKPSFKAFSSKEIQDATDNFSKSLMIGQGGYGKVYKCQLDNWNAAVKILDDQGGQGLKEYVKEMEVLETMRHENLIHLIGTCFKFRALVYEYAPNGSLEDCLKNRPKELTWEIRTRIVYEICTALRFLHANKPEPLVHGDLKPHNVLLDTNFKVKLTDFGLCRYLTQGENSKAFHDTLNVSGSPGYMDPDFLDSGKVTPGVDVYSFGKTVVRILTGRHPPDIFTEVHEAKKTRSFRTIVDPAVRDWPENVVKILAQFALKACKPDRNRSEFMGNFYSELQMILDGIDKCFKNRTGDQPDQDNGLGQTGSASWFNMCHLIGLCFFIVMYFSWYFHHY